MDQITLKNFRCFREEQTARLAPLTLLVGENSTGKTSFLAMIRAMRDLVCRDRVPDFKEEPYDLGSFDEIAHHRGARGSRAETFEAGFAVTLEDPSKDAGYRLNVVFGKKGTVPVPVKRCLSDSQKKVWIEHDLQPDGLWQLRFGTSRGIWTLDRNNVHYNIRSGNDGYVVPLFVLFHYFADNLRLLRKRREISSVLTKLSGSEQPSDSDWELIKNLCNRSRQGMSFSNELLYASAPVRSKPHRTYDPSRPTRDPEGDYVPMYLADLYFRDVTRWKALKDALEKFGKEAGLFDEISVMPLGKTASGPFQLQIRKFGRKAKGPQRNLIDVGYGVSQVLPVITELLRDDAPPIFLLQQPEVHLHPSAQATLGSLFCQVAKPERQLVVETHSDHLLDRVRMDVRDGVTKLKPEDVSILYFERDGLDVRIHSLRLDEEGNVLDAPPSYGAFFMEETERSVWKRHKK